MSEESRRINVTFPTQLLDALDDLVPPRKRSEIIVEATAAYVRKLKLVRILRDTAGTWSDADHPELATPEDINRWLEDNRSQWHSASLTDSGEEYA
jgi:hypothetical protein